MTITVEVLDPSQRVRIKKNEDIPYIGKRDLAKELGRSPTLLNKWERLLILYIPDFRKYFEPGKAWNFYQAWCVTILSDYRKSLPRSSPGSVVKDFITNNPQLLSEENYFNELTNTIRTENNIDNARYIQAA